MNHLTWHEVFQLIDEPADSSRRLELRDHLARCSRCRGLLETQRSLEQVARSLAPMEPSGDFTGKVLALLKESRKERRSLRLLTFLGGGIPLALVGLLIGYAIVVGGTTSEGGDDLFGGTVGDMGGFFERLQSSLGVILGDAGSAVGQTMHTDVLSIATLTVASVLLLFVADRVFLRRILRSRM